MPLHSCKVLTISMYCYLHLPLPKNMLTAVLVDRLTYRAIGSLVL